MISHKMSEITFEYSFFRFRFLMSHIVDACVSNNTEEKIIVFN